MKELDAPVDPLDGEGGDEPGPLDGVGGAVAQLALVVVAPRVHLA